MKTDQLKKLIREVLETLDEVSPPGWEKSTNSMKKPSYKNENEENEERYEAGYRESTGEWGVYEPSHHGTMRLVKSCDDREEAVMQADRMNRKKSPGIDEEHGDVHYWGDQPTGPNYKISTGYKDTVKLNEDEEQHGGEDEQLEMKSFQAIKMIAEKLIQMHTNHNYEEAQELELVRKLKHIVMQVESMHTGTKITANEENK